MGIGTYCVHSPPGEVVGNTNRVFILFPFLFFLFFLILFLFLCSLAYGVIVVPRKINPIHVYILAGKAQKRYRENCFPAFTSPAQGN